MSVKRKCEVVMLSTEKASHLHLVPKGEYKGRGKILKSDKLLYTLELTEYGYTPQHLYILSKEEIKVGDWYIVELYSIGGASAGLFIEQCKSINNEWVNEGQVDEVRHIKNCQKVIASTDKELNVPIPDGQYNIGRLTGCSKSLPTVSDSFIQAYIKSYNEGNPITEVMVEFEESKECDCYYTKFCHSTQLDSKTHCRDGGEFKTFLKLRGDEVIITKVNDRNPNNLEIGKTYWVKYLPCKSNWEKVTITRFTDMGWAWMEGKSRGINGIIAQEHYAISEAQPEEIKEVFTREEVEYLVNNYAMDVIMAKNAGKSIPYYIDWINKHI